MIDIKLKQLKESWAKFEEEELEEKLTPKERRKKQSKNMGIELEFASKNHPHEIESEINELVKEIFGDMYEASSDADTKSGKARVFEVTEDSSAALNQGDGGNNEESLQDIMDIIWNLYDFDYEKIREEVLDDARGDISEEDYETEEEYEEAIQNYVDENIVEKENDALETFLYGARESIGRKYGFEVANDLFDKLRMFPSLTELEYNDVSDMVYELGQYEDSLLSDNEDSYPVGIELITPRLMLNDDTIIKLSKLFYEVGEFGVMHNNAGLHVHIGLTEGMNFIHLLRLAYYLDTRGITKLAGREFNQWAQSHNRAYEKLDEIVDEVIHSGMSQEYAYVNLKQIMTLLVESRYKVANFVSMGKGTIEIRIGSSEITENPERFIKYMKFISGALDYALDDDFLETEKGTKLFIHDSGKWKIMKGDKLIASSALVDKNYLKSVGKSDSTVPLPPRTGGEEERTWNKIIKYLKTNKNALIALQKSFTNYLKTDPDGKQIAKSGHLSQYVDKFLKDGDFSGIEYLIKIKMLSPKTIINLLKAKK